MTSPKIGANVWEKEFAILGRKSPVRYAPDGTKVLFHRLSILDLIPSNALAAGSFSFPKAFPHDENVGANFLDM